MTETTSPPEVLTALFNRVTDRIEAAHGPARYRTEKFFARPGDEPFLTALWAPGGLHHGFKLFAAEGRGGDQLTRIVTWAHAGPLHQATATVAPELAEQVLLALLPPAIRPPARSPLAELADAITAEANDLDPDGATRAPDAELPGIPGNSYWRGVCTADGLRTAAHMAREAAHR